MNFGGGPMANNHDCVPVQSAGLPALAVLTRGSSPAHQFPVLPEAGGSMWPSFLTGQPERPLRVLLVDDDAHIRQVIAQELMRDPRTDVVAQGASLRQGIRLMGSHDFDVLLVDLNLGDGSGFDLIERMKASHPTAEAVVISTMEDEESAMHAFELGATGYLVKHSWFGNFSQAVLQVANGGAYITPNLARRLLHRLRPLSPLLTWQGGDLKEKLSEREREVLKMIASGYTSIEVGEQLRISHQTVNAHTKNIYRKLRVHNRAEASSFAVQSGIV
jgi:DNA-binding NarL/FixJ family response regulator